MTDSVYVLNTKTRQLSATVWSTLTSSADKYVREVVNADDDEECDDGREEVSIFNFSSLLISFDVYFLCRVDNYLKIIRSRMLASCIILCPK